MSANNTLNRILVIGGAGYVGSVLSCQLIKQNYKIRILDRLLYGSQSLKYLLALPQVLKDPQVLECQIGDFRNIDQITRAMQQIDTIIHLGAIVGDAACQINPRNTIQTNYIATRTIAQMAKNKRIKRFIFASTCSVYGASGDRQLTEDDPQSLNPLSLYARTKLNAEQAVLATTSDTFRPVILRFATIYGSSPRPRFDLVVNLLTAQAQTQQKITITNSTQWRPFIHVADVAKAIVKTINASRQIVGGQIFNVGVTRENYQLNQLGRHIKKLLPRTQIITQNNILDRRNYYVNFDKIKNTFNFTNARTISDGIQEIIDSLRTGKIKNFRQFDYNNYLALKCSKRLVPPPLPSETHSSDSGKWVDSIEIRIQ